MGQLQHAITVVYNSELIIDLILAARDVFFVGFCYLDVGHPKRIGCFLNNLQPFNTCCVSSYFIFQSIVIVYLIRSLGFQIQALNSCKSPYNRASSGDGKGSCSCKCKLARIVRGYNSVNGCGNGISVCNING